jgi:hypothetical protein
MSIEDKNLQNNLDGQLNEDEEEKHHDGRGNGENLTSEQYLAQIMIKTMRE